MDYVSLRKMFWGVKFEKGYVLIILLKWNIFKIF